MDATSSPCAETATYTHFLKIVPQTKIPSITMQKTFKNVTKKAVEGNNYTKLTRPKVSRGKTAFPSGPQLQKQLGVRYDYDGEVKRDGVDCYKYNVQPNAGEDIPSSIKRWRQDNGGTHKVMATVYVKKDGSKEDVEKALDEAHKSIKG